MIDVRESSPLPIGMVHQPGRGRQEAPRPQGGAYRGTGVVPKGGPANWNLLRAQEKAPEAAFPKEILWELEVQGIGSTNIHLCDDACYFIEQ